MRIVYLLANSSFPLLLLLERVQKHNQSMFNSKQKLVRAHTKPAAINGNKQKLQSRIVLTILRYCHRLKLDFHNIQGFMRFSKRFNGACLQINLPA